MRTRRSARFRDSFAERNRRYAGENPGGAPQPDRATCTERLSTPTCRTPLIRLIVKSIETALRKTEQRGCNQLGCRTKAVQLQCRSGPRLPVILADCHSTSDSCVPTISWPIDCATCCTNQLEATTSSIGSFWQASSRALQPSSE